jgi:hypothetical protein
MTLRYVLQSLRRRPQETFAAAIAVALTVAFRLSRYECGSVWASFVRQQEFDGSARQHH